MILRCACVVSAAVAPALAAALESDIRLVHLRVEGDTELASAAGEDSHEWDDAERWGLQYLLVLRVPVVGVHVGVEASARSAPTRASTTRSPPGMSWSARASR